MKLKRGLGFWMFLLIAINAIIGTGIFFAPGIAASVAGMNSIFSWIIATVISLFIALLLAELASIYPKAGGVYEYTQRAFGKEIGFFVGWISWVISNIVIAMLVVGGLDYLGVLFPISHGIKIIMAVAFIILINYISFKGIELSGKILVGFAIITISALTLVIISGGTAVNLEAMRAVQITSLSMALPIMVAMFYAIETFFGWETVTYLSEETKNPRKTIPKALILGTVMISILVMIVVFVSLTSVPIEEFGASNYPLLLVARNLFSERVVNIIAIFAALNILGGAASWIVSTPRLVYAMAKDKVLPESFGDVHKKNRTPYKAIIFQAAVTLLVVGSGSYWFLLDVVLPLAIIMYIIVMLAVPKLRISNPKIKRGFKAPFPFAISIIVAAVLIGALIISTTIHSLLLGFVLVSLGVPLFLIPSLGYHEKINKKISDFSAKISYFISKKKIEKDIIEHIENYISDITVERVLDLGCGVGVLTNKIAREVIPCDGRVYGIDFSKKSLKIANKISKLKDIKNVEFIYENFYNMEKSKELDKKLKKLDAVVGVGVLGHIDRLDFVLEQMNKRLRKNGKIYFVDYDYPGHFLDKYLLEHDDAIYELFESHGFKIKVWRQKKLFWTYVHIYGKKKD